MNTYKNHKSGFTLIELLVVIAIIGILTGIILVSIGQVRAKARDVRRKIELRSFANAIEIYFLTYDTYPPDLSECDTSQGDSCTVIAGGNWVAGGLSDLVAKGIIPFLPVDPLNTEKYYYMYEPSSGPIGPTHVNYGLDCPVGVTCGYILCANLENNNDPMRMPRAADWCGGPTGSEFSEPTADYCISGILSGYNIQFGPGPHVPCADNNY